MKIIAEVGSNWHYLQHCKDSIAQAKLCGADAVKFQLFNRKALFGFHRGPLDLESPGRLPQEWLPILKEKADACGIEFMCTAFSPELIDVVDPFVKTHKVASSDLTHVRMLQKLNKLGKPVYLSTGASTIHDIRMALDHLTDVPVTLMYCVASYPAKFIDFDQMEKLKELCSSVGYSDHSTDVAVIPMEAKRRGAQVLEKHVNFVGATGPDAPHSLSGDEFMVMVDRLNGHESLLNEERDMFLRHNRRLIAIKDIQPDERLEEGVNFGIYRSLKEDTKALSPFLIDEVNGKTVKALIKQGDGVSFDDIG